MDVIINALSNAAVLVPLAVGLSVIYRMSEVINFAAGTICVTCAYVLVEFDSTPAGIGAAVLVGAGLGILAYLTTVLPGRLLGAPPVAMTLGTVGFSVALEAVGHEVFGGVSTSLDSWVSGSMTIFGANLTYQRLIIIVAGAIVGLVAILLFDRTMIGRTMEACAADESLARLYGTNPSAFHLLAWAVCGICCAVTGILQVAVAGISVTLSMQLLLFALIGAVVGGIRGLRTSAGGVVLITFAGVLFARYVSTDYVLTPIFVLLLVALIIRPQGVFASTRTAERA